MKGRPANPVSRKRALVDVTKSVTSPAASAVKVNKKNKADPELPTNSQIEPEFKALNLMAELEKENVDPKPNTSPVQSLNLEVLPEFEEKESQKSTRRKNLDPVWVPYKYRPNRDTFSTFSMLAGKQENKDTVTSVIIHNTSDVVGNEEKEQFRKALEAEFKEVGTFQEIATITRVSAQGSPLQGRTTEGVIVNRNEETNTDGFRVSIFSSDISTPVKRSRPIEELDETVSATPFKANVKINASAIKEHEIFITPDFFKKVEKEKAKEGVSRNQNQVMKQLGLKEVKKASASRQAHHAQIGSEKTDWQWLHLIANFILGKKSQHDKNLVAGTKFSNAELLIAEAQLRKISESYPQGFTLKVQAHMVRGPKKKNSVEYTQIASKIIYTITTPDFSKAFKFNAQRQHAPTGSYFQYVTAVLSGMLKYFKKEARKDAKDITSLAYTLASTPSKKGLAPQTPQMKRTTSNPNQFFSPARTKSTPMLTPSKYATPKKKGM